MITAQGGHLLPNTTFEQAIEEEVSHMIKRGLLREGTLSFYLSMNKGGMSSTGQVVKVYRQF